MKCFVHIIFETRVIHEMCTLHLTPYFQRSNATISHHRFQVWWTIQDIFRTGIVHSILSKTLFLRVQKLKKNDIFICKLCTQSKHVKIYENLRISLNYARSRTPLLYTHTTHKLAFLCGIKLSESCQ